MNSRCKLCTLLQQESISVGRGTTLYVGCYFVKQMHRYYLEVFHFSIIHILWDVACGLDFTISSVLWEFESFFILVGNAAWMRLGATLFHIPTSICGVLFLSHTHGVCIALSGQYILLFY